MDFRLPLAFIVWPDALVKLFIAVLLVCASTILQAAPAVIDADTDGVPDTFTAQLSLSEHEACALGNNQAVCWGSSWMQAAPALSNPRALSSNAIPCAIDDSGIRCWGNYEDFTVPVVLDQPQALAVSGSNACVIDVKQRLICWDDSGKIIAKKSGATAVDANYRGWCALIKGKLICKHWPDGAALDYPRLKDVVAFDGVDEGCALLGSGKLRCWGTRHFFDGAFLDVEFPTSLSVGGDGVCANSAAGPVCIHRDYPENLLNPSSVVVGFSTCAVEQRGVFCGSFRRNAPDLTHWVDNCPGVFNPDQRDSDGDRIGDACDDLPEGDSDGVAFAQDNCPWVNNPDQLDGDADGIGDACDVDVDGDGVLNQFIPQLNNSNCALTAEGFTCRGGDGVERELPAQLSNPQMLAETCAIDNDKAVCWGHSANNHPYTPHLIQPSVLAGNSSLNCAIDVRGVHCWESDGPVPTPVLSNPTAISVGYRHVCALAVDGVHCWGDNPDGQVKVPTLSNPRAIAAGRDHSCALDDTGVVCWGGEIRGQAPVLQNPHAISLAANTVCALDDVGLHCWRLFQLSPFDQYQALPLVETVALTAVSRCALHAAGISCLEPVAMPRVNIRADNCPLHANSDQQDRDSDGAGDACDAFPDDEAESSDIDGDGIGDNSDPDIDNDGALNGADNCPNVFNPEQDDANGNNIGDACEDSDQDGVIDALDNCPMQPNREQDDFNQNGIGDVCEDADHDGVMDADDNCPLLANPVQTDSDNDGIGDTCDDSDGDSIADALDNCPWFANADQMDSLQNGIGDACREPVIDVALYEGEQKKQQLGQVIANAGDFDGDGVEDIVIGSPQYTVISWKGKALKAAGRAQVISGRTQAVLAEIQGERPRAQLGFAVAGAVDINGDGFADVVVGAPFDGLKRQGRVTVLYGPAGAWADELSENVPKSQFGSALAIGDLTGDGFADIAVTSAKAGVVTVYSGTTFDAVTWFAGSAKSLFGSALAIGDFDGDGRQDIAIGAPKAFGLGEVTVHTSEGYSQGIMLMRKRGTYSGSMFGSALAMADINGNGFAELLVGAPQDTDIENDDMKNKLKAAGSISVFNGKNGAPLFKAYGVTANASLGSSVATGKFSLAEPAAFAVGAPLDDAPTSHAKKPFKDAGSVTIWRGSDFSEFDRIYGTASKDYLGSQVIFGDVTGDKQAELLIGVPGADDAVNPKIKNTGALYVLQATGR